MQKGVKDDSPRDLLELFRTQSEPLFAILDAARDPKVINILGNFDQQFQSLYEGAKGEELAGFAPYLVSVSPHSKLIETLILECWGKSCGIFLTSGSSFKETRRHFRHFLLVETEDGRKFYFRFYDPRVLRVYLPTCTPAEIREFFGPLTCFLVEAREPANLVCFTQRGGELKETKYPITLRQAANRSKGV